jgi:hypothetical protein
MTNPITPPPKLVEEWWDLIPGRSTDWKRQLCTQAAQWGYDQRGSVNEAELQKARDEELEACCEWVRCPDTMHLGSSDLRAARRPKPPSLKEEALEAWEIANQTWTTVSDKKVATIILRAIKALPND